MILNKKYEFKNNRDLNAYFLYLEISFYKKIFDNLMCEI